MNPGYKTTEFWMTLLAQFAAVLGTVSEILPPKVGAVMLIVSQVGYALSRGLAKKQG